MTSSCHDSVVLVVAAGVRIPIRQQCPEGDTWPKTVIFPHCKRRTTMRFPNLSVGKKTFSKTSYFNLQTTALRYEIKYRLS